MRFIAILLVFFSAATAQLPFTDSEYDPSIPTLEEVVGHQPGEEITAPADAIRYMDALRAAAPDRMMLKPYATTWEGRPLVYGVIASEENLAAIEEIKADLDDLASGEGARTGKAERIIRERPAVVWLAYSVHGNEISGVDAGLSLAYHLLAAQDDPRVEAILKDTIVVIDPMQNPDGRARFVSNFEQARGLEIQGARYAAERDEPWPGGRYNHALFDLNRDWFTLSQPETAGKVRAIVEWNPVVVVDAHEMGSDNSYYFPPAARPFNPQLTENTRQGQEILGRTIAGAFDEEGIPYFTREVYDNFYPGFGDMWPALRGAVAMTFEQASSRGLAYDRANGERLTYGTTVRNQFLSTLMTAYGIAENKERFLTAYAEDRASAIKVNEAAPDRFTVVDLAERTGQAHDLARKLTDQGIAVQLLAPGSAACGVRYPEGAIVIDRAQPDGRLVRTLLDENTDLPAAYVEEQEDRRARGLGHQLYDVTAWSMPLMDGVSFSVCRNVPPGALSPYHEPDTEAALEHAEFAYVLPWSGAGQAEFLIAALRAGIRGLTTEEAFTVGEETFPRGTVLFPVKMNGADLADTLRTLLAEHRADLVPMQSSWVDAGPNYGSEAFREVTMPKVAMAWGDGMSPTSAGAARYVMERRLGVPVTPIRVGSLGRADLGRYDVLVVAETSGGFGSFLGGGGARAIQDFVEDGGVLVGFGSALDDFTSDQISLLALREELKAQAEPAGGGGDETDGPVPGTELASEADYREAIASEEPRPDRVPGVLLRASANPDHFLSAGYDEAIALFRGSTIYVPLREDQGTNVFSYAEADQLLASGYLWDDVRTQLARKPFVVATQRGGGMVIGFAQDPTVRGYLGGLDLLLANAIVLAPAYTD